MSSDSKFSIGRCPCGSQDGRSTVQVSRRLGVGRLIDTVELNTYGILREIRWRS